jgi:diguanylate cyclase (GGDEF)-like protein
LCELDQFSEVSAKLGQTAGDALLVEFRRRTRSLGQEALVGRSGQREFALLLSGFTEERAQARMERLCRDVARHPFEVAHEQLFSTTVSIGLVTAHQACSLDHLMCLAGKGLASARLGGQNRVCKESFDLPTAASLHNSTGLLVLEQKRRTIRKRCLRDIWVLSEAGDFGGKLLDLGVGGLRAQLDQPVKIRQPLEIALLEQPESTISTVVRWQRGGLCGLRFLDRPQDLVETWVGGLLGQDATEGERRQHARVPLRASMTLKTTSLVYACEVLSLGYGGISAQAQLTPSAGVEATVEIGNFVADVVVVWAAGGQFGLKFSKINRRHQHLLHELVKLASSGISPPSESAD